MLSFTWDMLATAVGSGLDVAPAHNQVVPGDKLVGLMVHVLSRAGSCCCHRPLKGGGGGSNNIISAGIFGYFHLVITR